MREAAAEPPLVSVITPCLNGARFITASIESVRGQDYPRVEHIVVDGGSTDGTLEILRQYRAQIRWVSEPDRGQSDALNKALGLARGALICWLNADDRFDRPDAISLAAAAFQAQDNLVLLYSDGVIVDEQDTPIERIAAPDFQYGELLLGNLVPGITPFFRAGPVRQAGGFRTDLHYVMDYDLWLRLCRLGRGQRHPQVLGRYRLCAGTKTFEHAERFWIEQVQVLETFAARPNLEAAERDRLARGADRTRWLAGLALLEKGDSSLALAFFLQALHASELFGADRAWTTAQALHWLHHSRHFGPEAGLARLQAVLRPHFADPRFWRKLTGQVRANLAFAARGAGSRRGRRLWLGALLSDPMLVRNPGFLSTGVEMFAGRTLADRARALALSIGAAREARRG